MLQFEVKDMNCNHCVASITKAVTAIDPDATVQADLDAHRVTVTGAVDVAAVVTALDDIGFPAQPVQD